MMKSKYLSHLPTVEILNVSTHGFGLLIFLIGIPLLCIKYQLVGWTWYDALGIGAFGLGLILVYTSSTGYHYSSGTCKVKWRVFDHIAILFLIGGSYTAYLLKYYNVPEGITLLVIQWSLILLGVIFKLFFTGRYNLLSTLLYVALGWMVVPILGPLSKAVPTTISPWIIAGGLSYSIGVGFYLWESFRYSHPIWHVFVLGGSLSHFLGLYLSV